MPTELTHLHTANVSPLSEYGSLFGGKSLAEGDSCGQPTLTESPGATLLSLCLAVQQNGEVQT